MGHQGQLAPMFREFGAQNTCTMYRRGAMYRSRLAAGHFLTRTGLKDKQESQGMIAVTVEGILLHRLKPLALTRLHIVSTCTDPVSGLGRLCSLLPKPRKLILPELPPPRDRHRGRVGTDRVTLVIAEINKK